MKQYDIIVLGPSGSGKTVFLASMYNKMSIQSEDIGFYLSVSPRQRRLLVEKYGELESGKWPRPTDRSEISEWNFMCEVQSDNLLQHEALKFNYIDYAGERLTEVLDEEEYSAFDLRVNEADILLGMLDGHKIYAAMSNTPFNGPSIFQDLRNILPEMQTRSIPVHFIITKWDLLHNKYSLRDVRNRLLEFEPFAELVRGRQNQRVPIRLIPVSSVGMNFAYLDGNGMMETRADVNPSPFQVEMPLACTLPDKLFVHLNNIVEREKILRQKEVEIKPNYTFLEGLGRFFGGALRRVNEFLPAPYRFGEVLLLKFVEHIEAPANEKATDAIARTEKLRAERDASLKEVKDEETAVRHVVNSMLYLANRLNRDFPESNLSRLY